MHANAYALVLYSVSGDFYIELHLFMRENDDKIVNLLLQPWRSSLGISVVSICVYLCNEAEGGVLFLIITCSYPLKITLPIEFFFQIDKADKESLGRAEAKCKGDVVCISAFSGEGVDAFCKAIQDKLKV